MVVVARCIAERRGNQQEVMNMADVGYRLTFKEFNQSLKKNKLLGIKCGECHSLTCPPKLACDRCGSTDLSVEELGGVGRVVTFTTSYVPGLGREIEAPVLVVMVELKEGPWIMGNLVGLDPDKATLETLVGKEVRLARTRLFPGDSYSGGQETQGGIARPTFTLV
ncbi:MAG: Zn-ribbon domain-containing OB-fold protein [Syntrophobacteraceae bacterium]